MKQRYYQLLAGAIAALVLVLLTGSHAKAGEIVRTGALPPQAADWQGSLKLDQFDPSIGRLLRTDVVISGQLEGTARYESLDSLATDITVQMMADAKLLWPDGEPIVAAYPVASRTQPTTEYDGKLDHAGTSGATLVGVIGYDISQAATFITNDELQPFVGQGQVNFAIDVTGRSRARGAGNISARFSLAASTQVTLTYIYGNPAIDIEKSTNGADADLPPGPYIPMGDPVTWEYVVTNTGDMTLTDVTVTDSQGVVVTCPKHILAPVEVMICTGQGIAALGQYANTGTVVGQPVDEFDIPRGAPVTDADDSHYYGDEVLCPASVLPDVEYLGESSGSPAQSFVLPSGYDTFVIKHRDPFHFELTEGTTNHAGQQVYNANSGVIERVWACHGNCQFTQALKQGLALGNLGPGAHIEMLILDADHPDRLEWWAANDPEVPYEMDDVYAMVAPVDFDVPFEAEWYFYTQDSLAVVSICIDEPVAASHEVSDGQQNSYYLPLVAQ
ncbi:MAG: choice-of-anchor E domain-containing protein [Caldilineaceae bacterium]|nr:choice-of-anchor E domain-containing protein [Caldilineaceae bacterium]